MKRLIKLNNIIKRNNIIKKNDIINVKFNNENDLTNAFLNAKLNSIIPYNDLNSNINYGYGATPEFKIDMKLTDINKIKDIILNNQNIKNHLIDISLNKVMNYEKYKMSNANNKYVQRLKNMNNTVEETNVQNNYFNEYIELIYNFNSVNEYDNKFPDIYKDKFNKLNNINILESNPKYSLITLI